MTLQKFVLNFQEHVCIRTADMILYVGFESREFLGVAVSDQMCSLVEDGLHGAQLEMCEPNVDSVSASGLPAAIHYGS